MRPKLKHMARWCEQHQRWECTKPRSRGRGPCHAQAITGCDACPVHVGKTIEQARQDAITAWALLPGDDGVTPLEAVGALLGLGYRRVALLADQLRAEAELSTEAVFGPLAEAERRERELLLRTALVAQQMGFEEHRHTVQMELGGQLIQLVRGLVRDLGHDDQAPEVAAVIRRHLLALEAG